ncbi:MAG: PspC domain-containing protein [Eubacteriaceae bacterium]|nr:PspC domain-containing protein [Eubacteriaceae bacterium]
MQNRLHRSNTDRKFGGVCAGIAESFGLDITLVRIAAFFLCILFPSAVIVYFVLALTMPLLPEDGEAALPARAMDLPTVLSTVSLKRALAVCAVCTPLGHIIYSALLHLQPGLKEDLTFAALSIGIYILTEGLATDRGASPERVSKISLGALGSFICLCLLLRRPLDGAFSFGYITSSLTYLWPVLLACAGLSLIMPKKKIATGIWWAAIILIIINSLITALGRFL